MDQVVPWRELCALTSAVFRNRDIWPDGMTKSNSPLCLSQLGFTLLLNAVGRRPWPRRVPQSARIRVPRTSVKRVRMFSRTPAIRSRRKVRIRLALSLNRFRPPSWRALLGRALFAAGRLEEALAELRFCAAKMPGYAPGFHALAAAAAETARVEEARATVGLLLRITQA
jgi:hypothetical protein